MSTFLDRSNYIKSIAMQNKLVAHNLLLDETTQQRRNSFFRINDQEELAGAVSEYGHLPCVVHLGFDVRYKQPVGAALPRKVLLTTLWFLSKLDLIAYPNKADAIEAAHDESFRVLTQFLSFLLHDQEVNECTCCAFDFETAHSEMIGPELNDLYGWQLQITDSKAGEELTYNPANWLGNPDAAPAPEGAPAPQYYNTGNDAEFINFFPWEDEKIIPWTATRQARFGDSPSFQICYPEGAAMRFINAIVEADAVPPLATQFKVFINTPGTGVIVIKR